jgi:hypothetical protein
MGIWEETYYAGSGSMAALGTDDLLLGGHGTSNRTPPGPHAILDPKQVASIALEIPLTDRVCFDQVE